MVSLVCSLGETLLVGLVYCLSFRSDDNMSFVTGKKSRTIPSGSPTC